MNATRQLHELDKPLTRQHHSRAPDERNARFIGEFAVTGLTSNPTIFDHAIKNGAFYDDAIRRTSLAGKSEKTLFFELATEDLVQESRKSRVWYRFVSPLLIDRRWGRFTDAASPSGSASRSPKERLSKSVHHGRTSR
jgi:Transaldolase/Fructose-6-phosphate aldolase